MEPGITFRKMPPLHYEPRENKNANRWINTKPSSNRINKNRSRSLFQPPLPDKRSTSVFLYRVRFLQSSLHASMRKEIGSWFERDMENSFSIKVEGLISTFDPIFTLPFSFECLYLSLLPLQYDVISPSFSYCRLDDLCRGAGMELSFRCFSKDIVVKFLDRAVLDLRYLIKICKFLLCRKFVGFYIYKYVMRTKFRIYRKEIGILTFQFFFLF